jgi:hypothetical protein
MNREPNGFARIGAAQWLVRLDASIDPVLVVAAADWYEARAFAAELLDVDKARLHVTLSLAGRSR